MDLGEKYVSALFYNIKKKSDACVCVLPGWGWLLPYDRSEIWSSRDIPHLLKWEDHLCTDAGTDALLLHEGSEGTGTHAYQYIYSVNF